MTVDHDLTTSELETFGRLLATNRTRWYQIRHYQDSTKISHPNVRMEGGVLVEASASDGTPAAVVVRSVLSVLEREHARRSASAKRAAATRAIRQRRRVYEAARLLRAHQLTPRDYCRVCRRGLNDPESIGRGIGSECWQDVLAALAALPIATDETPTLFRNSETERRAG